MGVKVPGPGKPGPAGKDGVNGTNGIDGKDGVSPTLTIGTVSGLPSAATPTASITGTSPNLKLNLGLAAGANGTNGTTPSLSIAGVTTLAPGAQATASLTPAGAITLGIPQGISGTNGSNATATPLATTAPKAPATAAVGTSTNAAREDHVHPREVQLIGTVTVTEQTAIALALGMKRMTLPLTGITMADMGKLLVIPNGTATTGCEVQNAYPVAANSVSIGYFTPALGLLTTYSIPVAVYRIV